MKTITLEATVVSRQGHTIEAKYESRGISIPQIFIRQHGGMGSRNSVQDSTKLAEGDTFFVDLRLPNISRPAHSL